MPRRGLHHAGRSRSRSKKRSHPGRRRRAHLASRPRAACCSCHNSGRDGDPCISADLIRTASCTKSRQEEDMRHIQRVGFVAVALMASAGLVSAAITEGQRQRIRDSAAVLDEIHGAPDKGIPENLWEKAACVVVIPGVKKGAFVVGGEYGKGVMSCREGARWSALSSVMLAKGSIGFQIGGEAVDLVLLVMNEGGMKKLLEDKVTLGGEASIAGGPVG